MGRTRKGTQDAQGTQDVVDVLDVAQDDAQESAQDATRTRRIVSPVVIRDAHVMTYDRATDFYRKDRDADSLRTSDLGTRVLFHVRDARDADASHLIIATCVAFSLDSVSLSQGDATYNLPMTRVLGIRRARREDARERRAMRRERKQEEKRAQRLAQGESVQTRARTSVVSTSLADVL